MNLKKRDALIFFGLFVLLLFLALNRHSKHPIFEYHAEIYSDKAGYHMYLPALFYYNFDGNIFPKDIDKKTGTGFKIEGNKVITKYPVGVAIFQLPFFCVAAVIDKISGNKDNLGFTSIQHRAIDWATTFFGTLGLMFLFIVATGHFKLSRSKGYLLLVFIVGCSNLLYYLTRDCGMSHAYSFFVFSAMLFLIYKIRKKGLITWQQISLLCMLLGLTVSLRQINILFIMLPLLFLFFELRRKIWITVPTFLKGLAIGAILGFVPILLQLMYNKYAYSHWLADTYKNETFSNWNNLKLFRFWLSPYNGALLYCPVFILVVIGSFMGIKKYGIGALTFVLYLLLIGFTYAAWWWPELGCGFGNRGFTEHLAFLSLPCIWFIKAQSKIAIKVYWVIGIAIMLLLFIAQFNYDGCWYGKNAWDWSYFFNLFLIK
jgi:hypothetical protein